MKTDGQEGWWASIGKWSITETKYIGKVKFGCWTGLSLFRNFRHRISKFPRVAVDASPLTRVAFMFSIIPVVLEYQYRVFSHASGWFFFAFIRIFARAEEG